VSVRRQGGTSRHPQTASVVWGWRLEAALALGAFVILRVSAQLGSGGSLLVGGITAKALSHSPELRAKLLARLDQAQFRRKMTAGFRRCGNVGYFGDTPKITQVGGDFKPDRRRGQAGRTIRQELGLAPTAN